MVRKFFFFLCIFFTSYKLFNVKKRIERSGEHKLFGHIFIAGDEIFIKNILFFAVAAHFLSVHHHGKICLFL